MLNVYPCRNISLIFKTWWPSNVRITCKMPQKNPILCVFLFYSSRPSFLVFRDHVTMKCIILPEDQARQKKGDLKDCPPPRGACPPHPSPPAAGWRPPLASLGDAPPPPPPPAPRGQPGSPASPPGEAAGDRTGRPAPSPPVASTAEVQVRQVPWI